MFRKKYYLAFVKRTGTGDINKAYNKLELFLYRSDGKFYTSHRLYPICTMFWLQAWFWWWCIKLFGRKSKRLFAYRFPAGACYVMKAKEHQIIRPAGKKSKS